MASTPTKPDARQLADNDGAAFPAAVVCAAAVSLVIILLALVRVMAAVVELVPVIVLPAIVVLNAIPDVLSLLVVLADCPVAIPVLPVLTIVPFPSFVALPIMVPFRTIVLFIGIGTGVYEAVLVAVPCRVREAMISEAEACGTVVTGTRYVCTSEGRAANHAGVAPASNCWVTG